LVDCTAAVPVTLCASEKASCWSISDMMFSFL
jgi:hypothetical protein